MKKQGCDHTSLPTDLAFQIVSLLQAPDVCSLGSCSRFWREICGSDCLWKSFFQQRWPELASLHEETSISPGKSHFLESDQEKDAPLEKGWKGIYSKQHTEIAGKVLSMQKSLTGECTSIDDYLKVIKDMESMKLNFKDVQIYFLNSNTNVLLNLAGLHYSIKHLNAPVEDVLQAITASQIQERPLCIQWRRRAGWIHRFPLPDELRCYTASLGELITTTKGNDALDVLNNGLTFEIVQVNISSSTGEGSLMGGIEFRHVLRFPTCILRASDVCSLGSCSRFWREICDSDCLWEFLYEERWPELASLHEESLASPGESHCPEFDQEKDGRLKKGWKEIYSKRYTEITREVLSMPKRLAGEYIDIDDYFKVI